MRIRLDGRCVGIGGAIQPPLTDPATDERYVVVGGQRRIEGHDDRDQHECVDGDRCNRGRAHPLRERRERWQAGRQLEPACRRQQRHNRGPGGTDQMRLVAVVIQAERDAERGAWRRDPERARNGAREPKGDRGAVAPCRRLEGSRPSDTQQHDNRPDHREQPAAVPQVAAGYCRPIRNWHTHHRNPEGQDP